MISRLGEKNINCILAWHGTKENNIDSIVKNNFDLNRISQSSGDYGFYGKGIYFSEFARISSGYDRTHCKLLLCRVLLGKQYNVQTHNGSMVGSPLMRGYDSHVVNYNYLLGQKYGQEVVIFNCDQILPCYIVHY